MMPYVLEPCRRRQRREQHIARTGNTVETRVLIRVIEAALFGDDRSFFGSDWHRPDLQSVVSRGEDKMLTSILMPIRSK